MAYSDFTSNDMGSQGMGEEMKPKMPPEGMPPGEDNDKPADH